MGNGTSSMKRSGIDVSAVALIFPIDDIIYELAIIG